MNGLHAVYYTNTPHLAGQPAKASHGISGVTGGAVDKDWGTTAPVTGVSADNWSMRLTGLITFPQAGTYALRLTNDDTAKVFIGDVLNVTAPATPAVHDTLGAPITIATAGETRRIRIEYSELTGSSLLRLAWITPSNGTFTVVPGAHLRPDYGLVTSTTAEDSAPTGITGISDTLVPDVTSVFTYTHPWLGQPSSSTVDPGGLNLTTATDYEQPGAAGWLRRTMRALPAITAVSGGSTNRTQTAYYGDLETGPTACGLTEVKQFGMTKSTTSPAPASGSPVVTEYLYDVMGRTVGVKTSGDTGWSCAAYDNRGRATTQTTAGASGAPTLTTTTTYTIPTTPGAQVAVSDGAVPGSPNGSTITTRTDLLGRETRYEDVWATVTIPTYHPQTGRVTSSSTTPASGSATVTEYAYDTDGKITEVKIGGRSTPPPATTQPNSWPRSPTWAVHA